MNEVMYDILESCIQELDNNIEIEVILARYPEFARELRPILNASLQAKQMTAPAPSRDAVTRGRARLMQKVAEIREEKIAPRKRMIPLFQRLAISFALTATLLLSGTGLVGASASALPGQKLYPVKRGWEDLRLFLTFNEEKRESLEKELEQERLHEVDELLFEEEHLLVDFSGVFTHKNGLTYVSEVQVLLPVGAEFPQEGATLHIVGWTEKGYVEVTRFEIILGKPIAPTVAPNPLPVVQPTETKPSGFEGENQNGNENLNGNENQNENQNENENENGNENLNGNENENENGNENLNGNENQNENGNENLNGNENQNENGNENLNGNENQNENGNGNEGGGGENENGGGGGENENENENNNDAVNNNI